MLQMLSSEMRASNSLKWRLILIRHALCQIWKSFCVDFKQIPKPNIQTFEFVVFMHFYGFYIISCIGQFIDYGMFLVGAFKNKVPIIILVSVFFHHAKLRSVQTVQIPRVKIFSRHPFNLGPEYQDYSPGTTNSIFMCEFFWAFEPKFFFVIPTLHIPKNFPQRHPGL